jgi:glycosyltransferase involved in cell wall biosynthesis
MACGCIVVGYHGNGAREYMTPDMCFPIEVGDIVGFARTTEAVLKNLCASASHYAEMSAKAAVFVRSAYSRDEECRSVQAAWQTILGVTFAN